MAYKSGKCFVCREQKAVQSHHLLPREYGGAEDGPQIDVCPSCHLICHYEAEILYKTGDYSRLEESFTAAAVQRAIKVIDYIVKQRSQFEAAGKPAADARRRVNLNFSHDELQLMHDLKRVLKFKSLERLIKACILVALREQRKKGRI